MQLITWQQKTTLRDLISPVIIVGITACRDSAAHITAGNENAIIVLYAAGSFDIKPLLRNQPSFLEKVSHLFFLVVGGRIKVYVKMLCVFFRQKKDFYHFSLLCSVASPKKL